MTARKLNPKWPNKRPDVDTSEIVALYESGLSSPNIGKRLGCCSRTVSLRLAAAGIAMRPKGKIKTYTGAHPSFKGEAVSYPQFHRRLYVAFGQPSLCTRCGRTDDGVAYDWANLTGDYTDPHDFARMCRPCHRRYDYERRKAPILEAIRNSTESARSLERRYGVDHRVIRRIRASKSYAGSDVAEQVAPAVDAYFAALEAVQARVNGATP